MKVIQNGLQITQSNSPLKFLQRAKWVEITIFQWLKLEHVQQRPTDDFALVYFHYTKIY